MWAHSLKRNVELSRYWDAKSKQNPPLIRQTQGSQNLRFKSLLIWLLTCANFTLTSNLALKTDFHLEMKYVSKKTALMTWFSVTREKSFS